MGKYLRRLGDHPGWVAFFAWWCGPVWVAALTAKTDATGGYIWWFVAIWTLIGLALICATVEPPRTATGDERSESEGP